MRTDAAVQSEGHREEGEVAPRLFSEEATMGTSAVQPLCNDKASVRFAPAYNKPTGCVPCAARNDMQNAADACQMAVQGAFPTATTPTRAHVRRRG
jgi:hypothetical protein